MMLADNPANMLRFFRGIVGAKLPDNVPGSFIDDGNNVRFPCIPDHIIGMEAFVPAS